MEDNFEVKIVETYGNAETYPASTVVVGFEEENARAWQKTRDSVNDEWTDWQPVGSAADYESNMQFADLHGCSHNLTKTPPPAAPQNPA